MVLPLVIAPGGKIGQPLKAEPGPVFFLQLGPNLFPLQGRHLRVLIDPGLEFVHHSAVGDEVQAVFQLVGAELLRLFSKEALVPGAGKQLHGHGVDFRALHGGGGVFQIPQVPGPIGGKGVAGLVGQHLHVVYGAVKVGEDKGALIAGQLRAVTAAGLALFALQIEELVLHHKIEELPGLGAHLPVHLLGGLHQGLLAPCRRRVPLGQQGVLVPEPQLRQPQPGGLALLELLHHRHQIRRHLIPEGRHIRRGVAVAPQPVIAQLDKVLIPQLVGLLGAALHQGVIEFVQPFPVLRKKGVGFFPGLPAELPVRGGLVADDFREVALLPLDGNPGRGQQALILGGQPVFLLHQGDDFRGEGLFGDFLVPEKQLPCGLFQLRPEGGSQHLVHKLLDVLLEHRQGLVKKLLFLPVKGVGGVNAVADIGQVPHGAQIL